MGFQEAEDEEDASEHRLEAPKIVLPKLKDSSIEVLGFCLTQVKGDGFQGLRVFTTALQQCSSLGGGAGQCYY